MALLSAANTDGRGLHKERMLMIVLTYPSLNASVLVQVDSVGYGHAPAKHSKQGYFSTKTLTIYEK